MIPTPTQEQIAAARALSEAMLQFLLSLKPNEPKPAPEPLQKLATTGVPSLGVASEGAAGASEHETSAEKAILVGLREAAKLLSVCEKTLWSLTVPRGPIPAVRFGRLSGIRWMT